MERTTAWQSTQRRDSAYVKCSTVMLTLIAKGDPRRVVIKELIIVTEEKGEWAKYKFDTKGKVLYFRSSRNTCRASRQIEGHTVHVEGISDNNNDSPDF